MIRKIGLFVLVGSGLARGVPLTLTSGSEPTCVGLGSVAAGSACEEDMVGFTQGGLTAGTIQSDFVIPSANYTPLVNADEWTAPIDGATWISIENTGWNSATSGPVNTLPNADCTGSPITKGGNCEPNGEFFLSFNTSLTSPVLNLTVWADDSAGVLVLSSFSSTAPTSLTLLSALSPGATTDQGAGTCSAAGFVTCNGPGTDFVYDLPGPGTYTVEFDTYQTGGFAYGLMYAGSITEGGAAPEPGPFLLLGSGLAAIAILRRRLAA
jgi:hypothetical protein